MTRVALALGANLGDREANLATAVAALAASPHVSLVAVSDVYETDPVGGPEQPAYLNAVVIADTDLAPEDLLARCHDIEQQCGRTREVHWGPRTVDIDVLVHGQQVLDGPMVLPHPRAHERAFVLVPWVQVAPDMEVPGRASVAELATSVGDAGVRWFAPAVTLQAART